MTLKQRLAGCVLAAAAAWLPSTAGAALIGGAPQEPVIDFGGAGIVNYDATSGILTISGIPASLLRSDPFLFGTIVGSGVDAERLFTIQIRVSAAGALVSGVDGPDFKVIGAVDVDFDGVVDYEGVLLEGEVTQFGFQDSATGTTDAFDFRLQITGGALAGLYTTPGLTAQVVSEASTEFPNPFAGSFATNFIGQAKGVVGAEATVVVEAPCKVAVEAFCSLDGQRYSSKCRIKQHKSPKFWDYAPRVCHGVTYHRYAYGLHGTTEPAWSRNRPHESTEVRFRYIVKNTGTTPITGLMLDDSFDTEITGYATTLAVGQSITVNRTERLRESIENAVLVTGANGGLQCSATDSVVIREPLRERRKHDADRFRDKDDRDDNGRLR